MAGALALIEPRAHAQTGAPLVVVVSSNPDAPFVRRLGAELSLFGYRVELAAPESDADLGDLLTRRGGAALIAVDQRRQTAEVIVGEPAGSGPLRRDRERLDPRRQADTNAAVLAERFRARLTQLGIAPAASEMPAEVPSMNEAVPEPAPEPPFRRWWLAAALGASSGGWGWTPDAQLELRAFPNRWLSASAFGKLSLSTEIRAREGSADVRLFAAGLLLDAYPLRGDWSLRVGLGALLIDAAMSGRAAPPWRGQDVSVLVPGGLFETALARQLSARVSAELRGFVGVSSSRVVVRVADQRVSHFGPPFVGVSLGVAVGVF